jgi:hypothetical protein
MGVRKDPGGHLLPLGASSGAAAVHGELLQQVDRSTYPPCFRASTPSPRGSGGTPDEMDLLQQVDRSTYPPCFRASTPSGTRRASRATEVAGCPGAWAPLALMARYDEATWNFT